MLPRIIKSRIYSYQNEYTIRSHQAVCKRLRKGTCGGLIEPSSCEIEKILLSTIRPIPDAVGRIKSH